MRLALVLLTVSSLAVRWMDAGCGCAAHNHWASLVDGLNVSLAHEPHSHADEPAFDHGCAGECGVARYVVGNKLPTHMPAALPESVASAPWAAALATEGGSVSFARRSLPRAVLQVYRI